MTSESASPAPPQAAAAQIATSDAELLSTLVNDFGAAIFRVARSIVGDNATAEDVTQETLVKVWKALPEFRGESSLKSWVLRIAHNTAISTVRRRRDVLQDPLTMPEARSANDTEREAHGLVALDHLNAALAELDPTSRAIVVLRELEGLSYQEIAEVLKVPLPTVKTRLLRARRHLSRVLEEWRP